jgi:hypothetical protein
MKLNLLPQTVSKGRALKSAWFVFVIMLAAACAIAAMLIINSQKALKDAEDSVQAKQQDAADAVATSAQADAQIAKAADLIRDASLAQAMIDHNDVYPKLYDDLLPYVPSFFRLTSITATPVDATTSSVTMTGTLETYQQYADLMLALMRFKDATSISRTGFNFDESLVPPISQDNLNPMPHKPSEPVIPSDQLERLQYYQSLGRTAGYTGQGNFGSGDPDVVRGAMPGESLITVVLTVKRDLQVPDPQATLLAAGSAAAPAAGGLGGMPTGPGGPGMMGPGGPGGMGPGGPPPGVPGGNPRGGPSNAARGD